VIITTMRDGTPYVWEVDGKRIEIDKATGTSKVELQAARETDVHGTGLVASTPAPVGTLTHRIIRRR
jgi:hypothetical protein